MEDTRDDRQQVRHCRSLTLRGGRLVHLMDLREDTVTLVGNAIFTGSPVTIKHVPIEGIQRWLDGTLIQDALPCLTDEEREFLISGLDPAVQDDVFRNMEKV